LPSASADRPGEGLGEQERKETCEKKGKGRRGKSIVRALLSAFTLTADSPRGLAPLTRPGKKGKKKNLAGEKKKKEKKKRRGPLFSDRH